MAYAEDFDTRTSISGQSLVWDAEDEIKVFSSNSAWKFFLKESGSSPVRFYGPLDMALVEGEEYHALYPFSAGAQWDGHGFELDFSSAQEACAGSFAKGVNIAVARTKDRELHFKNVCGAVRFSVSREDIVKVTLSGNRNEVLAGAVDIVFSGEEPVVDKIQNGTTSLSLEYPDSRPFAKGDWYYFASLPAEMEEGATLTFFTSDGHTGSADLPSMTVSRSSVVSLESVDAQVGSWGEDDGLPAPEISVKSLTVELPEAETPEYYSKLKVCSLWGESPLGEAVKNPETKDAEYGAGSVVEFNPLIWTTNYYYSLVVVEDEDGGILLCSKISPDDPNPSCSAETTALAIITQSPLFITANKNEYKALVEELAGLGSFKLLVRCISDAVRVAEYRGQSIDFSNIDVTPVYLELIEESIANPYKETLGLSLKGPFRKEDSMDFTLVNYFRRVVHVYGRELWMDSTNERPIEEKLIGYPLTQVFDMIVGSNNKVKKELEITDEDVKSVNEMLEDMEDLGEVFDISIKIPIPYVFTPPSASFFQMAKGLFKWEDTPIYESSHNFSFPVTYYGPEVADRIAVDVYGFARPSNPLSSYPQEEQIKIVLAFAHGILNDFIIPTVESVFGMFAVVQAEGFDDFKYDFRYGNRKAPEQALLCKLASNFVQSDEYKTFRDNLSNFEFGTCAYTMIKFTIGEIVGNKHPDGKRTYWNLIYNCCKKWFGVSSVKKVTREKLKKAFNNMSFLYNANFSLKVIDVIDHLMDVGGASYAYENSNVVDRGSYPVKDRTYIEIISPTDVISPYKDQSVNLKWRFHRQDLKGVVDYEVVFYVSDGKTLTEAKSYSVKSDTSLTFRASDVDIPGYSGAAGVKYRITASIGKIQYASTDYITLTDNSGVIEDIPGHNL